MNTSVNQGNSLASTLFPPEVMPAKPATPPTVVDQPQANTTPAQQPNQTTIDASHKPSIPLDPHLNQGGTGNNNNVQTVLDLLKSETSKDAPHVTSPTANPQQQGQPQAQQQQQPPANEGTAIDSFFRLNPIPDLLKDYPEDKLQQVLSSDNVTDFRSMLSNLGENATKVALESFLKLMPEVTEHIRGLVSQDIKTHTMQNDTWHEFTTQHPEFKAYRGQLENQLVGAISKVGANADKQSMFSAFAMLNQGWANDASNPAINSKNEGNQANGQVFDLGRFLGS